MDQVLAVDLGGTKLLAGIVGKDLEVHGREKVSTPANASGDEIVDLIVQAFDELKKKSPDEAGRVTAVGVVVPGSVNKATGVVLGTPNIGFGNFPLQSRLSKALNLPVIVENDVNAGVYGEYAHGAGQGYKDVVGVYPGSGIGGGLILNGQLFRGANGAAGELGHMKVQSMGKLCGCGAYGCLETLASKNAIARDAVFLASTGQAPTVWEQAKSDFKKVKSGTLKKAIENGETAIQELVERAAHFLGIGMANCINIFNPELIVLGGGLMEKLGDLILPIAEKVMRETAMPYLVKDVKVVEAKLGDDSVMIGVSALVLEEHGE